MDVQAGWKGDSVIMKRDRLRSLGRKVLGGGTRINLDLTDKPKGPQPCQCEHGTHKEPCLIASCYTVLATFGKFRICGECQSLHPIPEEYRLQETRRHKHSVTIVGPDPDVAEMQRNDPETA